MRRMNGMWMKQRVARGVTAISVCLMTGLLLSAGAASAIPANLDSFFGFDDANLGGLPSVTMDVETPFLGAGRAGSGPMGADPDVVLGGSTDICILPSGGSTCQADLTGITGPYSVLVSLQVTAVTAPEIDGPFTLFLSGLSGTEYATNEVAVELNPVLPAGFDPSPVPGFVFGGTFTDYVHVIDETYSPTILDYIGWTVDVGDFVSFQYDVLTAPNGRVRPELTANAIPLAIIPEPGTALLMGLGLAGLSLAGRKLE